MPFTVIRSYTCHDISTPKLLIINILDKYFDEILRRLNVWFFKNKLCEWLKRCDIKNSVKMWTLSFYFSTFGVLIILLFVLVYKFNFEHSSHNHQIKNSPNIYIRKDLEPATVKSFCPLNSFNLIWLKFNSETAIQISQLALFVSVFALHLWLFSAGADFLLSSEL